MAFVLKTFMRNGNLLGIRVSSVVANKKSYHNDTNLNNLKLLKPQKHEKVILLFCIYYIYLSIKSLF